MRVKTATQKKVAVLVSAILIAALLPIAGAAQGTGTAAAFTWDQIKARFEVSNPTLKANQANVDESKAEETTAFLRPNPEVSLAADGTQVTRLNGVCTQIKGRTF